jgi:hypothetical protein
MAQHLLDRGHRGFVHGSDRQPGFRHGRLEGAASFTGAEVRGQGISLTAVRLA